MQSVTPEPILLKLNRAVVIPSCDGLTPEVIRSNRLDVVRTWRIHIFVDSIQFTKDPFVNALREIHPMAHIYLHVWKCHVDMVKLLEHSEAGTLPNVRIVRENPMLPVQFAIPCYYGELLRTPKQEKATYRPMLTFRYHDHVGVMNRNHRSYDQANIWDCIQHDDYIQSMLRQNSWIGEIDHPSAKVKGEELTISRISNPDMERGRMYTSCEVTVEYTKKNIQYYCDYIDLKNRQRDEFPFRTHATKAQPELFREEIIARFKQVTPPSILKGFKDDDDIWDFVSNN